MDLINWLFVSVTATFAAVGFIYAGLGGAILGAGTVIFSTPVILRYSRTIAFFLFAGLGYFLWGASF